MLLQLSLNLCMQSVHICTPIQRYEHNIVLPLCLQALNAVGSTATPAL